MAYCGKRIKSSISKSELNSNLRISASLALMRNEMIVPHFLRWLFWYSRVTGQYIDELGRGISLTFLIQQVIGVAPLGSGEINSKRQGSWSLPFALYPIFYSYAWLGRMKINNILQHLKSTREIIYRVFVILVFGRIFYNLRRAFHFYRYPS